MDLVDLVRLLCRKDALGARTWMEASRRAGFDWALVPQPSGMDPLGMAVAAGVTEMLALRAGKTPPAWTAGIPGVDGPVFLVRAAEVMPRLRRLCESHGPEPLRSRGILAPPEFLTAA